MMLDQGNLQGLCEDGSLAGHIRVMSPDPSMVRDPLDGSEDLQVVNHISEHGLRAKDTAFSENTLGLVRRHIGNAHWEDKFSW